MFGNSRRRRRRWNQHIKSLDELINDVFTTQGLSSKELEHRHKVALDIEEFIVKHIPELKIRVYGSTLTGFGLKDAGLDLHLVYQEGANPAHCLAEVYKLLLKSDEFTNVKSNFAAKIPAVLFTSPCKTLHCKITVGSISAYLTSRYLSIYRELDERCRKLAVVFKYWAKICKLDQQHQGTLPAYCYSLMTVSFLQRRDPPVLPILWKDRSEQALKRPISLFNGEHMLSKLKCQPWVSKNTQSVGDLWITLIDLYQDFFCVDKSVICINSRYSEKSRNSNRIAIEDPFSPEQNAGRSMHHPRLISFFNTCLRNAYQYFKLPSDSNSHSLLQTSDSSPQLRQTFQFAFSMFTDGEDLPVLCPICGKEDHLEANCPEDQFPKVIFIAQPSKAHLRLLTRAVKQCMKENALTSGEISVRESIRQSLEIYLQELSPGAEMELFGSTVNGIGFHESDLDFSVTFKGKKAEEVNVDEHLRAICTKLRTHEDLLWVASIMTAKVPIVKFKHNREILMVDISLYNELGVQNTRLLRTYAEIDPRVKTLGYAIKVFVKKCNIGDASKGSLSSYAYVIMMIHYLQQTKPPVIPVLQELRLPGNPDPQLMIEGWNAWFFDDFSKMKTVWPHLGKNTDSVGVLWEGFFRYFIEEFKFDEQVVTIRQLEKLSKFEKLWNGKGLAIEDPFDLSRNLGGGLSRKMNHFILSTLVRARELYSTSVANDTESLSTADLMLYNHEYFFDKRKLVTEDPASDRTCYNCWKIGHIAKECPMKYFDL